MNLPAWWPRFVAPRRLREAGVLGMNRRNHAYIMRYNRRHDYPDVDDKSRTKRLAIQHGVATAEPLGVVERQYEVADFPRLLADAPDFVIKPGHGSGGRGILVIQRREGENYVKTNGKVCDYSFVYDHISHILSGLYSLGGQPDYALFERRIDFSDVYRDFSFQGVPDVRIIVFQGYPVMAMMRLATRESDGRANLHQGAIGVGLDLRDGTPRYAAAHNRRVTHHPDTGAEIARLVVPEWEKHLEIAVRCARMTPLGYIGVDIATDRVRGPLLLELNARPGLAIQIANGRGLLTRLRWVESLPPDAHPGVEDKIAFVQSTF